MHKGSSLAMLYCRCGFSCGTQAAFDRHLSRVTKEDPTSAGDHGIARSSVTSAGSRPSVTSRGVGVPCSRTPEAAAHESKRDQLEGSNKSSLGSDGVRTLKLGMSSTALDGTSTLKLGTDSTALDGTSTLKLGTSGTTVDGTSTLKLGTASAGSMSMTLPSFPFGRNRHRLGSRDRLGSVSDVSELSPSADRRTRLGSDCSELSAGSVSLRTGSGDYSRSPISNATTPIPTPALSLENSPCPPSRLSQTLPGWTPSFNVIPPGGTLPGTLPGVVPETGEVVRLKIIRHAESANKDKAARKSLGSTFAASKDPGLTAFGLQQAEALGQRISREMRPGLSPSGSLLVVSSPMRRCLLTISPAIAKLGLTPSDCICHGGCYEYGCAGSLYRGTTWSTIVEEFPAFSPACFNEEGTWDYRGKSEKESEAECCERAVRVIQWLLNEVAPELRKKPKGMNGHIILLVIHQTLADVICQLLAEGTTAGWRYGDIRFRMGNASITEVLLYPDGRTQMGRSGCDMHLLSLKRGSSRSRPSYTC